MLDKLNEESKKVGLHMNFSKTKVMYNKHVVDKDTTIKIENEKLKRVESQKH